MTIAPADMTLDELRLALAPLVPANAVFDGWSDKALAMAAAELGIPAGRAKLCFPGGAPDMIEAWFDSIDRDMAEAFPLERIEAMKIRERIRALVMFRLESAVPHQGSASPGARDPGSAPESAAGEQARLERGGPDVADRRRYIRPTSTITASARS